MFLRFQNPLRVCCLSLAWSSISIISSLTKFGVCGSSIAILSSFWFGSYLRSPRLFKRGDSVEAFETFHVTKAGEVILLDRITGMKIWVSDWRTFDLDSLNSKVGRGMSFTIVTTCSYNMVTFLEFFSLTILDQLFVRPNYGRKLDVQ